MKPTATAKQVETGESQRRTAHAGPEFVAVVSTSLPR